ncbi:acyltransferase [Massilia forsythiae]|uniref:Acyltransferase n=1 Tax=Massilia forsythiae TaxID=2728020 RepID=A0A7Z2W160_9BURK|nr:acyltransferase family protein [Massilia forsythiae]QJE02883.1 acyltransferase [Massilia forsythiae]
MISLQFPTIQWQRQNQLDGRCANSFLIALMRGLAALEVAAAHLRAEMFPGLSELANPPLHYQMLALATSFAHQAVVIFFLISGWLVGGSLLNKLDQPGALHVYAIDRATRLWTVLMPALCLMLAIGGVIGAVQSGQADFSTANEYSAASFAGNLLGLQTIVVPTFAGNYALWSLANETWYYVQFPLLLIAFTGKNRLRQLSACTALLLMGAALPLPITLYFALWLLGTLFSRIRIDCTPPWRIAMLLAALAIAAGSRVFGQVDDLEADSFLQHLAYSLPLLALLAALYRPLDLASPLRHCLARSVHLLSECSFTLYVIHVPLIKLSRHLGMELFGRDRLAVTAPADYAVYAGMLLFVLLASYCSYLLFESNTFRIRRAVKAVLPPSSKRPSMTAA